jgi:hypothetical protein
MGMMGKAVLIAVWVVLGHPPVVQQVEVKDLDKCTELRNAMDRDHMKFGKGSAFMAYCSPR